MREEAKQPEPVSPKKHYTTHQLISLFQHRPYPHQPRNVNALHKEEQANAGVNQHVAILLTKGVGTMWTAYVFTLLAIIGLLGILGLLNPVIILLVSWTSQTLIQLVLLPVIMVGQNVLGHHAELMAEEQFKTTQNTYHDIEEVMQHLAAQDAELLKQSHMIIHLLKASGIPLEQVTVIQNNGDVATAEVQTKE
jgi:hypothetical protein